MTTKTIKVLFFAALIAAVTVPIAGMDFATGQEQDAKQKLEIEKPERSAERIAIDIRAEALFAEEANLYEEGAALKAKYDAGGMEALTPEDIQKLDRITVDLADVKKRIDQLNADARALITMTEAEKATLHAAVVIIRESNAPITGVASDQNNEAVRVYFENEEIAKEYAPVIEEMIDVPFYTDIRGPIILDACNSLTSDCDPLLGGVKIQTEFNSTHTANCSYSTAADRDVWWWTDYGFITAAHCFKNNANGNDVNQPTTAQSKIGDLSVWYWPTTNADCDCAFVLKTGSEQHWKAAYEGPNDPVSFAGFSDPAVNDFVRIVGHASGIHTVQVDALDFSATAYSQDSPPVSHSMINMIDMDDWGTSSGDSGGAVHGTGSDPDYHGIIHGHTGDSGSTGHTIASPWSQVQNRLGLN